MREEWRKCLEGFYEISSLGRIRREENKRLLKIFCLQKYPNVVVSIRGEVRSHSIHRLVARAFHGPCPRGKEVNHKDGVKTNCIATNLEYKTRLQNLRHAIRMGLTATGERNGRAKLSWEKVTRIRKLYKDGFYQKDLAKMFKVSQWVIWCLLNGRTWKVSP